MALITLDCKVCQKKFSQSERFPHILKSCGHSFCKPCIQSLIDIETKSNRESVSCPMCRSVEPINKQSSDFESNFPKNYLFSEMECNYCTTTESGERKNEFICMDKKCTKSELFDWKESRKTHSGCSEHFISKFNYTSFNVTPKANEISSLFDLDKVKAGIKSTISKIENTLVSIAENYRKVIQQEVDYFTSISADLSAIARHKQLFEVKKPDLDQDHFEFRLLNFDTIKLQCQQFTDLLHGKFEAESFKMMNKLLIDNTGYFGSLNQPQFQSRVELLNKIKAIDYNLHFSLYLKNFKLKLPFDFCEFFDNLKQFDSKVKFDVEVRKDGGFCDAYINNIKTVLEKHLMSKVFSKPQFETIFGEDMKITFKEEYFVSLYSDKVNKGQDHPKLVCKLRILNTHYTCSVQKIK